MEKYTGKILSRGIAAGPLWYYRKPENLPVSREITDPGEEWQRFLAGRKEAVCQLERLHKKAVREAGEENAAVFLAHTMMLEDEEYESYVREVIESRKGGAEYASAVAGNHFAGIFEGMEDEYFRARALDIRDVSDRVVAVLTKRPLKKIPGAAPVILAARDLLPGQLAEWDRKKILGFVTEFGTVHSHTAVLARGMGIPALCEIPVKKEWNGKMAELDGRKGTLYIEPEDKSLEEVGKT